VKHLPLHIIVFISGAAVLAIEILGTRILGPFYGVSLFLWSALITVTLIALSIGYWVGGRWADRGARLSRLGVLLAAAGVWLLMIPWIRAPLLAVAEPFGLRLAVLVAAFVLFAPPLTLLGMVSPFAIRLKAESVEHVGRTAGDLFAISTVASVVSALATGFWLIPSVGVARLTQLIGATLLAAAALAWVTARRERGHPRRDATVLAALAIAGAAFGIARAPQSGAAPGVIALEESPYAEIRVVDSDDKRFLLIDGGVHTVVDRDSWQTYFPYVPVVDLVRYMFDAPGRLLLVGLGGGSVAKNFAGAGWRVDAVEIDPAITRVARDYFGLDSTEGEVYTGDGRAYLLATNHRYDAIVIDAFGSSSIPFHLVTAEVFSLMKSRLDSEGVLAINIEAVGWDDPIVRAFVRTLQLSFPHVLVLPLAEPPNMLGNLVLLASARPLTFPDERLERPFDHLAEPYMHWCAVQRNHAWNNRFVPEVEDAVLFTDDRNQVDIMAERINLAARRALHDNASLHGTAW
jgi:spermidine synthase